jgi:methylated-DNA-[protein]-cysteine S-methyltransferase
MTEKEAVHYYQSRNVGWLELRTTPKGVSSISYAQSAPAKRTKATDPIMNQLVKELDGYFAGKLTSFSVPLDPPEATPFLRRVWEELVRIPYGETRSYGQIAQSVGNPGAARAVGSANHRNCIPILIPCHRVIKGDGTLGGYASGLDIKKTLLALEGAKLPR